MRIFPKSSSLDGVVNYIKTRTDSHNKIYEFFKNIVLSTEEISKLSVDFTEKDQYLNSEYPINEDGYVLTPDDMFGGEYTANHPIIKTFDNFPKNKKIPNIIDGKPNETILISKGLDNNINLALDTMSKLSNSVVTKKEKIKYWPTFKIGGFFPSEYSTSNDHQLVSTGTTPLNTQFSIIKICPTFEEKFHHIDIEYVASNPKMIIFILLDSKNIVDGDSVEFKINVLTEGEPIDTNSWPLVLFVENTYTNITHSSQVLYDNLVKSRNCISIDGIEYTYINKNELTDELSQHLRFSEYSVDESYGYLISVDTINSIYSNKYGKFKEIVFEGNCNTIEYSDYGYLNNEQARLDHNNTIYTMTRPVYGDNSNILADSKVIFAKDSIQFSTINGSCANFGASTNKNTYDLSSYSETTPLELMKIKTEYLPNDYPVQIKLDIINFSKKINSGLFYTFEISHDLLDDNYFIIKSGIQYTDSFFTLRVHSDKIIIDIDGICNSISSSSSAYSVDIAFKRIKNTIFKKILVRASDALIYESKWLFCNKISCEIDQVGSIYFENYQLSNVSSTQHDNLTKISNILTYSELSSSEVDSLFNLSKKNGVYSRFNNVDSCIPKILPISQIEGLLSVVTKYPKSNVNMKFNNLDNDIHSNISFRVGFIGHTNKGDFRYKVNKNPILDSSLLVSNKVIELNACSLFPFKNVIANVSCNGIVDESDNDYFKDINSTNQFNYKISSKVFNTKILNNNTLISFGKCGYLPKVTSETSYVDSGTAVLFDNDSQDTIYSGDLQSLKISSASIYSRNALPIKILHQDSNNISNTINRFIYNIDPRVTITNKKSNICEFFDVSLGTNIDTFSEISNKYYKYTIAHGYFGATILAPTVTNPADVVNYKKIGWQLRLIKKNIDINTVQFSDIDLDLDTVIIQTTTSDMSYYSITNCGLFVVEFDFVGKGANAISPDLTKYLLNGVLITMTNETLNTNGSVVGAPRLVDGNWLVVSINSHLPVINNKITYEKLPLEINPNADSVSNEDILSNIKYEKLDSEYIGKFNDQPTINRFILSTCYQIPKYPK